MSPGPPTQVNMNQIMRQPKEMLNKSEVLNHQTIQENHHTRNNNIKSRDRAGVHLPQVPMTPTEEQKRMAKNRNNNTNNNNTNNQDDRYKNA